MIAVLSSSEQVPRISHSGPHSPPRSRDRQCADQREKTLGGQRDPVQQPETGQPGSQQGLSRVQGARTSSGQCPGPDPTLRHPQLSPAPLSLSALVWGRGVSPQVRVGRGAESGNRRCVGRGAGREVGDSVAGGMGREPGQRETRGAGRVRALGVREGARVRGRAGRGGELGVRGGVGRGPGGAAPPEAGAGRGGQEPAGCGEGRAARRRR